MAFSTHFSRPVVKGVEFTTPSLVQPQFQSDSDINVLVRRALGGDPSAFANGCRYADVSESPDDFHGLMNEQKHAEMLWDQLPDAVKHAYGDIATFISAVDKAKQDLDKAKAKPVSVESAPLPDSSPSQKAENTDSTSVSNT